MFDALQATVKAAAAGLTAQSTRMRVASENLANAQSTGDTPGSNPYQRKLVNFRGMLDEMSGADLVTVDRITRDNAPFRTEYKPGHPAADDKGYVKLPNVDMLVETADMREASRSYTANLQVIKQAREMVSMTIDLMKVS
ncbi:MAG: flagellar basal body rod protein FlgC [Hyphomicrobium sp.]|nr:flagellar basal body rod protein FlgC [Hyphomicrobium sp.]